MFVWLTTQTGAEKTGLDLGDAASAFAVVVAIGAAAVSYYVGRRQLRLSRQANQIPALVGLFEEHRSPELAAARAYLASPAFRAIGTGGFSGGLSMLAPQPREQVLKLMWFYDNLGALIAHDIVDIDPVSGYLGGSITCSWSQLRPLVEAERTKRATHTDPGRWQEYFENLATLFATEEFQPEACRRRQHHWLV